MEVTAFGFGIHNYDTSLFQNAVLRQWHDFHLSQLGGVFCLFFKSILSDRSCSHKQSPRCIFSFDLLIKLPTFSTLRGTFITNSYQNALC